MTRYEITSIDRNENGSYSVNYAASDGSICWCASRQYYGYSKREALRQARQDLNIKRNPYTIRDNTRKN